MKTLNKFTSFDYAEKVAKDYDAVISIGFKLNDEFFNPECKRMYLDFEDIEFSDLNANPGATFDKIPKESDILQIINFVKQLNPHEKLLIHCFAGYSRSPAATVIAMCERDGKTFDEAVKIVKSCRIPNQETIKPNDIMLHHYLNVR